MRDGEGVLEMVGVLVGLADTSDGEEVLDGESEGETEGVRDALFDG